MYFEMVAFEAQPDNTTILSCPLKDMSLQVLLNVLPLKLSHDRQPPSRTVIVVKDAHLVTKYRRKKNQYTKKYTLTRTRHANNKKPIDLESNQIEIKMKGLF